MERYNQSSSAMPVHVPVKVCWCHLCMYQVSVSDHARWTLLQDHGLPDELAQSRALGCVAELGEAELQRRLREVCDEELRDLLGLLMQLDPAERPSAEQVTTYYDMYVCIATLLVAQRR